MTAAIRSNTRDGLLTRSSRIRLPIRLRATFARCIAPATGGNKSVAMPRKNQRGTLLLGLLLVAVGLAIFLAPSGSGLGGWLMRLWPVFMICAGVVRVMGYAVERKPRSPMGGTLLIIIGAVFFV